MERDYNLEKRKYVIGASVIVIVLIYLIRLFTLQIMSEDYKKNADSNAFLNKTQYPSRGVMYDRNRSEEHTSNSSHNVASRMPSSA